ncbi:MAG: hypothetical protein A2X23_07630 [Chloroflexi bacterium GWC2_73_18]|nr:MAG: hypothetical protein A2X23_07630 [Chloroflexi bacterium GWC2_73_18]
MTFVDLHCHSNFSFLDGASPVESLIERAAELGMPALAVTDHDGLYGAVRFAAAALEAGIRPIVGVELVLRDPIVPDPAGVVVPRRRAARQRPGGDGLERDRHGGDRADGGRPERPHAERRRLPGHREAVREDLRGVRDDERGPHLVLLAGDDAGYRSLCRLVSRANLAGTKAMPRITQALLADQTEGVVALSGCRHGEIARRLLAGDRAGARAAAEAYARLFGVGGSSGPRPAGSGAGFYLELQHHLLPDDDWLVAETARLAAETGIGVVVSNDAHYATPEGRELQDVLVAIRHGLTLDESAHLRRPNGEYHLKSAAELAALPPGDPARADPLTVRAWRAGLAAAGELAERCRVDLGFERYRFPGFAVPRGETPFSELERLCHEGARRRYHPITPAVLRQLAHELEVIERTGLAEFFLICWDLMRFARERGIPAQGRGSAGDSIVAYVLGITRVDPIRHRLLFERFINEGRTTYPDIDIDFASSRREEVIRYVYERYGAEHTGMVCNLVTYRARSAVREVGYALGFPRPLVDRVAKALETYDSVMVRRDLEAEGGFAQFFAAPATPIAAARATDANPNPNAAASAGLGPSTEQVGFTDRMGRLDHAGGERRSAGNGIAPAGNGIAPAGNGIAPAGNGIAPAGNGIAPAGNGIAPAGGRPRGSSDDEGGPGDTPVSVAWLRVGAGAVTLGDAALAALSVELLPGNEQGRPTREEGSRDDRRGRRTLLDGRDDAAGSGSGRDAVADRGSGTSDPRPANGSTDTRVVDAGVGPAVDAGVGPVPRPAPHSAVARRPAGPDPQPLPRGGSTAGLSPWERWLELCARIDGFPRHLSIHVGGMLVTAAPLIDIAPLERATMPGRVVVQYDKRDVEALKLVKLDLLGLRMLSAIDEAVRLAEADCGVCLDLDRLPEELPEVFRMLGAADTVGVFQVESRAQMQTLPKSRPTTLDDLVVEVAIIRPGPIQGNAVHPYLRRRQGLEPVAYLHPSLEPILAETLGVILYQEQVMEIAIRVAGFTAGESDGFRRAMGTWRSSWEMEKLHQRFVDGCRATSGLGDAQAEELFRQVAAFASFGFNKSHAAAFARTAYESAFLKLYYPAQFVVGLINAQPMGFYPVEVLVNDARRHGVAVLPVDVNRSRYRTTTEWIGLPGEPLPPEAGIARRPPVVRSPACVVPDPAIRARLAAPSAAGFAIRLGISLVNGIGEEHEALLDAEFARGPYRSLADVVARTGLPEETIERLIRAGALDSLERPRRELLWQLREVAGATHGRVDGRPTGSGRASKRAAGRPLDLGLPPTEAPDLPAPSELERLGDSYAVLALDARRQVVDLFRPALRRLGAVTVAALADHPRGTVAIGGLVVTRQHPMTAKGTVFLALEDETGMANVTLWPDAWAGLRGVVRRHALLYVEGQLQREAGVVNLVARRIEPLVAVAACAGGPEAAPGVRQLGHAGTRRQG